VLQAGVQVVHQGQGGAHEQVPVDQHAGVLLLLAQAQDRPGHAGCLVEVAAEAIEVAQVPQHREQLRDLPPLE
jgi:hypothetical protein